MKRILLAALVLAVFWKLFSGSDEITLGPGVMAKEAPYQQNMSPSVAYKNDEYTITELAKFQIKAKVLSKTNYYRGREADLSPTDLALGWGKMSDESVLEHIKISQSNRFYFWRVESFPIPRREIETHSANMHLIPANDFIKKEIGRVKQGGIIEITGSLVNVNATDGWHWSSSQTRNDTGNGACELVWVENLRIVSL